MKHIGRRGEVSRHLAFGVVLRVLNAPYKGSEAHVRVRGYFDCPVCSRRNTPFDLLGDETESPADED